MHSGRRASAIVPIKGPIVAAGHDFEDRLRAFLASCVRDIELSKLDESGSAAAPEPMERAAKGATGPESMTGALEPTIVPDDEAPLARAKRFASEGLITSAETIYAELATGSGDVEAMLDYGEFLTAQHRKTQAAAMYERAVGLARALGDDVLLGRSEVGQSRLLGRLGRVSEAVLLARAAVSHLAIERGPFSAEAQINLADLLSGHDDRAEQESLLLNSEQLLAGDSRPFLLARAATVRARLAEEEGDFSRAATLYREAIHISEKANAREDLGDLYVGLGSALESLGDLEGARTAYLDAEQVLESTRDLSKLADAVDHLGRVAETLGQDEEAQRAFDKAAGLFETTQRFEAASDAYTSLGKLHEAAGRKTDAELALRQALDLAANTKGGDEVQELYARLDALIAGSAKPDAT